MKDEEFHRLRKAYVEAAGALDDYIPNPDDEEFDEDEEDNETEKDTEEED